MTSAFARLLATDDFKKVSHLLRIFNVVNEDVLRSEVTDVLPEEVELGATS